MKKLITLFFVVGIVFAGMFLGSPYYKAYQLKQAYDNQDGVTIANAIDYPKLTGNVNTQITTRFTNILEKYPLIAKLGGKSLSENSDKFINHAVNGAIAKDNIENIIRTQGQANLETKELVAAWAIASDKIDMSSLVQDLITQRGNMKAVLKNQIDTMMTQQSSELAEHAQSGKDTSKPILKYCGVNCFNISGYVKGYPITLQLERDGLTDWKVVGVKLP